MSSYIVIDIVEFLNECPAYELSGMMKAEFKPYLGVDGGYTPPRQNVIKLWSSVYHQLYELRLYQNKYHLIVLKGEENKELLELYGKHYDVIF